MVRCALLRTHAEEMDWLADSIAHLVRTGKAPGEIAVLCRTATDFAEIQGALVARDIPVEVVGLSGLLHLPEVADLVAVCEVLQDPGANASLVRLLTGPRWRIGARDLALLGRRARLLVSHARVGADDDPDRRLAAAVEGIDPAEIISLADALDTFLETPLGDHGDDDGLPFSADARVRFARLATELRDLRRSLSDPLMDVLHRVLATTGLEVELSASPHALAARRRETLSNFLDIAASFAANDGEASSSPSSASCAPPPSTRRASTTPCRAVRTLSRCSPRTSPRAWNGTSSRSRASSPEPSPAARVARSGPHRARSCRTSSAATPTPCRTSAPGTPAA